MNILIVTGVFPPDIGGPATYVPEMARALVKRGHTVTVLTLSDDVKGLRDDYTFSVTRLPRSSYKAWRWTRTVARIIHLGSKNADVLFVNGLAMEAALANYLLRKPIVHKVVGDWAWERSTIRGWVTENFEEFQDQCHGIRVEALKTLQRWRLCKIPKNGYK